MTSDYVIYEIAGLAVKMQGLGEKLKKRMSEYVLPLPKEGEHACDLGVFVHRTDAQITLPEKYKTLQTGTFWNLIETENGQGAYRYLTAIPDELSMRMDFFRNRTDITILSLTEDDAVGREYAFTGYAISQMMLNHRRMVLHSSCISVNGQAVLFSAPSGTGKSTHTGLWQKYVKDTVYINDDTPIIRLDCEDGVYACGSPWSGKTDLNTNISSPLKGIVFLERGTKNYIEPISGTEAVARLLGETRKLPFKDAVDQAAELCFELVKRVPVYRLTCDISKEAVDVVYQAVFKD